MSASIVPLKLNKIRKVWILGAGFFGQRALIAVQKHLNNLAERVLVVDRDPQRLANLDADIVCGEAVDWLSANLPEPDEHHLEDHLIIPALPLHVAAEWLRMGHGAHGGREHPPVPPELLALLPNAHPFPGSGRLYTSIATWRCPDDCPAPASHCTHTGLPRDPDLHDALGRLRLTAWKPIVIHSHQVAPGVGGYTARQLWDARASFAHAKHAEAGSAVAGSAAIIATICRCHGVLDMVAHRT